MVAKRNIIVSMLAFFLWTSVVLAEASFEPQTQYEGWYGYFPVAWNNDGSTFAITSWKKAGLALVSVESNEVTVVSQERGAGFAPIWINDDLFFKEVVTTSGGDMMHQIVRYTSGEKQIVQQNKRLGEVAASRFGVMAWTQGEALTVFNQNYDISKQRIKPKQIELGGYSNIVALDPSGEKIAYADQSGRITVYDSSRGTTIYLTKAGAYAYPSWSASGDMLLFRGPQQTFSIVSVPDGKLIYYGQGTHPQWFYDHVIFERVTSDWHEVINSDLWMLNIQTLVTRQITQTDRLHERYPLPDRLHNKLVFTDTISGSLYRADMDHDGVIIEDSVTPMVLPDSIFQEALSTSPSVTAALKYSVENSIDVPYLHQVWDTPNEFSGYWSCGPTSCMMLVEKYTDLEPHPIIVDSPSPHTSNYGWYIPNEYSYNGYDYDILGKAHNDQWVAGAHGFICRDFGGAIGSQLITFLRQHDISSWYAGESFATLVSEIDSGYPMVLLMYIRDLSHIVVARGYRDDHSVIVNDPYGDGNSAEYKSGSNYNGANVIYDWPGYNNGHVEITTVNELFGSRGTSSGNSQWDATLYAVGYPQELVGNTTYEAYIAFQNTGTRTWQADQVFLGTAQPHDRVSEFYDSLNWMAPHRPSAITSNVIPGDIGYFYFTLQAPAVYEGTSFVENWGLLNQDGFWFAPIDEAVSFSMYVWPEGSIIGRPYWDADWYAQSNPDTMTSGEAVIASIDFINQGKSDWVPGEVFLATSGPMDRESEFYVPMNWIAPHRAATVSQIVAPGEVGRFEFTLAAPQVSQETHYREFWGLVQGDANWFGPAHSTLLFDMTVLPKQTLDQSGGCDCHSSSPGSWWIFLIGMLMYSGIIKPLWTMLVKRLESAM